MCSGFFTGAGELASNSWSTVLPFTDNKTSGSLISYNSSSKKITLKKGHSYSMVFSGTVAVSSKSADQKCGASLTDGYDTTGAMFFATQIYTILDKANQSARLTLSYNTVYTAADNDITLNLAYNNMLFQGANFDGSRYNVTIIALD